MVEEFNNTETKTRQKKVLEFFGRVKTKKEIKQNDLEVEIYDNAKVDNIQVMKDNVSDEIWEAVLNSDYYNRNFVFYCHQQGQRYRLTNWKIDSKIGDDE